MKWIRCIDEMPVIPEGKHGVTVLVAEFDPCYDEINPGCGYDVSVAIFGYVDYDTMPMFVGSVYNNKQTTFMVEYMKGNGEIELGIPNNIITHWILLKNTISHKKIKLTQGQFTIVDDEDFEELSKYHWQATKRCDNMGFYAIRSGGIRMHRQILNVYNSNIIVDHINGNGLDNRRSNLRIGTQSLNCVNRKRTPGKYMRGARLKNGKWCSYIKINGIQKHLGMFNSELEAHNAYLIEAQKMYNNWVPEELYKPEPPVYDAKVLNPIFKHYHETAKPQSPLKEI